MLSIFRFENILLLSQYASMNLVKSEDVSLEWYY